MAIVNPEISNILPNIFTKTAISIIKEYPTAKDLQKATPKKLCKVFRNIKGNNFNEEKAKALIALSKDSIYLGRAQSARSLMITTNINILELIVQEKAALESEIKILIENNQDENFTNGVENLKTIPGVADKTISAILG
jgi:endonuclease III